VGNLFAGKFVVDGCNLHKGGEFLCTFSSEFDPINKCRDTVCIATLLMLFVKVLLRGNKVKIFL
jgi:hypothetical protein